MTATDFDAIVVGSGFGGAVAGARLAQAGLRVAILERGRRWPRGSFPRDQRSLRAGWLWADGQGLYDVRWLDRMVSVQGAGWGGGSLVYANVFSRPSEETFRPHWPASYSRASLDPYFDLAAHMLEVRPVGPDPATGEVPLRTRAMEDLVERMDRPSGTVRPNLAVRFAEDPARPVQNRHGVTQYGCTFVGECVLGCNQGAKNSLDYNYLAVAEAAGAVAVTGAEVTGVADTDGGYRVMFRDHGAGSVTEGGRPAADGGQRSLTAVTLFLAAGSVGTTELLLRARDVDQTLPRLSPRLGEGFSGNGDFLTLIRRSAIPLDPERGPTITTTSVVDFDEAGDQVWFQVQDGAYPAVLSGLVAGLNPVRFLRDQVFRVLPRLTRTSARSRSVLALLLMGRDASEGRLVLDHHGEAAVEWDNRANLRLYRAEGQVGRAVARMLGGRAAAAPTWSLLRRAVTVHNLGGVPMGDDAAGGVVDEHGEVHGYPGLYVVDGAAVPSATGVNPSASIAAVAERNVERAIRRITQNPDWVAPETPHVVRGDIPEDRAMREMSRRRHERSGRGVRFTEAMAGSLQLGDRRRPTTLTLRAHIPGWNPFLGDPRHPIAVSGTLDIDGLASSRPVAGQLQLFPEAGDVAMRYLLEATDDQGRPLALTGVKRQHRFNPFALWRDLTTLSLHAAEGRGTLRISPLGALALASSIRGDAFTRGARVAAVGRFLSFFARQALRGLGRR